jgi:carnitine 3-dehydrogenase
MIGYDEVRLHIYQYVTDTARKITVATGEHLMVHVDTNIRHRTAMPSYMGECMVQAMEKWALLSQAADEWP